MDSLVFFILGLFLGSFLNLCAHRIPRGEPFVAGRSHCPACRHPLGPLTLIPVVSYLALRGRCRYCGVRISPRYPITELIAGALYLLAYQSLGYTWALLSGLALLSVLLMTSLMDIEFRVIPDRVLLFGAAAGLALNLLGAGRPVVDGLLGLLLGGGSLFLVGWAAGLIARREAMGGGDIKLMGMAGLFLGFRLTAVALFLAVVLGGVWGAALLLSRRGRWGAEMPFGPFLALGAAGALFWGERLLARYLLWAQL